MVGLGGRKEEIEGFCYLMEDALRSVTANTLPTAGSKKLAAAS